MIFHKITEPFTGRGTRAGAAPRAHPPATGTTRRGWCLSLHTLSLRSIQWSVTGGDHSFTALEPSVTWMSHKAFTQGSVPGPSPGPGSCKQCCCVHAFGDTGTCLCWVELVNLRVDVCSALRCCQNNCAHLHSHPQGVRVTVARISFNTGFVSCL